MNSTRTIYTYFESIPQLDPKNEIALIRLWQSNWEANGWKAEVLNEYHAKSHPFYSVFRDAVRKLPSVNPGDYDYHCFMRWLALSNQCDAITAQVCMSDYDTMSYGFEPAYLPTGKLGLYQRHVPALISGTRWAIDKLCERFAQYKIRDTDKEGDRVHCSDMKCIESFIQEAPEDFHVEHIVRLYGEEGWEVAPAVHFSNSTMQPAGKMPRYKFIPELRKI